MIKGKPSELIYKFMLSLLIVDAALYHTTISESLKDPFHNVCLIGVMICGLINLWLKKYTIKYLILNVFILLFAIVSYGISGNTDILTSILLVMLAWRIDIDEILKIIFPIRVVVFLSTVCLSLIGILDRGTIALTSAGKSVLFGYGHANTFAGSAGILIFLMFAIHRKKLKRIHFLIAIIEDIVVFYFSRSRTSLILISALILILLICKYYQKMNKLILKIGRYSQGVLLLLIFGLIFLRIEGMLPGVTDCADKIMNGRITLAVMNLVYYPITWMGQRIDISRIVMHNVYYALDNGFVYILIHYGIIGLGVLVGLQQKAIEQCIKKEDVVLVVICILILVWMAYEGMMISATSNFTLLFATAILDVKSKGLKKKDNKGSKV